MKRSRAPRFDVGAETLLKPAAVAGRQPLAKVLGDTLAWMTRRERGVRPCDDMNTDILAIANGKIQVSRALPVHVRFCFRLV